MLLGYWQKKLWKKKLRKFILTEGDTNIMESGFGSKVGIGYGYSLGGSRIMASANMYFNFIDLSEATVSILEDFTKYNMLKINLGMLF